MSRCFILDKRYHVLIWKVLFFIPNSSQRWSLLLLKRDNKAILRLSFQLLFIIHILQKALFMQYGLVVLFIIRESKKNDDPAWSRFFSRIKDDSILLWSSSMYPTVQEGFCKALQRVLINRELDDSKFLTRLSQIFHKWNSFLLQKPPLLYWIAF